MPTSISELILRGIGKKIVAVGRNFSLHAKELNNPLPEIPLIFLKPTSSYIFPGKALEIPSFTSSLHHEVELGVVISDKCSRIHPDDWQNFVLGYVLALDMTARDLQSVAKSKGEPWSISKGCDGFTPVSNKIIPKEQVNVLPGGFVDVNLWCKVNGTMRQNGNTRDMIFPLGEILSFISQRITLEPGDLVLTGTPSGVDKVEAGDVIEAGIGQIDRMEFVVE